MARFDKALVDADMLLFRAAAALETEVDFGDDGVFLYTSIDAVRDNMLEELSAYMKLVDAEEPIMTFTSGINWRKIENPEYKANRRGKRKPLGMKSLIEWCKDEMHTIQYDKLEADDVMGIKQTCGENTIIITGDKDMQSIPGWLFDFGRHDIPVYISEVDADFQCAVQGFMGDSTDGFGGCPGVGIKTAVKHLELFKTDSGFDSVGAWEVVLEAYEKKGLDADFAIMNARMARITRKGDWDFKNSEMIWRPGK